LEKVAELARKVQKPESESSYPQAINTGPRRALYDNLGKDEELAVRVDTAIREIKMDGWRGKRFKEREVRGAIKSVLGDNAELVNAIFAIAEKQHEY
jgi:type I restriction enzyme R subunit